ncbi:hypothetical protein HK100_006725 [Physocladia obscura]|uniref:Uncharacterized protein n=1 Tax=Physocladia obscura TaxID=109957 RepID=A0AAD5SS86_9FUNG|nr:hypothetical protein HK100_006725 [Physocladia obscura]
MTVFVDKLGFTIGTDNQVVLYVGYTTTLVGKTALASFQAGDTVLCTVSGTAVALGQFSCDFTPPAGSTTESVTATVNLGSASSSISSTFTFVGFGSDASSTTSSVISSASGTTQSSTPISGNSSSSGTNFGAIIGSIVAVFILAVGGLVFWKRKNLHSRREQFLNEAEWINVSAIPPALPPKESDSLDKSEDFSHQTGNGLSYSTAATTGASSSSYQQPKAENSHKHGTYESVSYTQEIQQFGGSPTIYVPPQPIRGAIDANYSTALPSFSEQASGIQQQLIQQQRQFNLNTDAYATYMIMQQKQAFEAAVIAAKEQKVHYPGYYDQQGQYHYYSAEQSAQLKQIADWQ